MSIYEIRDEYAETTVAPLLGELQERLRRTLAEQGWTVPTSECLLPMRCPARGYCTLFLEGSQTDPCQQP